MGFFRGIGVLAISALATIVLATACGAKEEPIPTVAVTATDYAFGIADSIPGGLTRLDLTNSGKESHHLQFLRLNDGVTVQQFQSTLQAALQAVPTEGEAALFRIFSIVTFTGGPSGIGPGGTSEAIQDIQPGQYVLVCFIPSPDGVPHLAKGMVKPLTVTAAPSKKPAEPKAAASVNLEDFKFTGVPQTLSKGKSTIKVSNIGKEPHEMSVLRLKGITVAQFAQALSAPPGQAPAGPPPYEDASGFQAIMPGASGWATLDLTAGEYALVCFVPSPANQGAPHVALGMLGSFKVQ